MINVFIDSLVDSRGIFFYLLYGEAAPGLSLVYSRCIYSISDIKCLIGR